jgi:hypothetical protein
VTTEAAPVRIAGLASTVCRRCATLHRGVRNTAKSQYVLDAEAGQISAELAQRGIAAHARMRVLVEIIDADTPPMSVIAQFGKGLDWLADESDLYADTDLVERAG